MKMHTIILASIATLATAIPLSPSDYNKKQVKRGLFENISNFPFLASAGSSSSSSSSSSKVHKDEHDDVHEHDFHHETLPDFHSVSHTSHVIHHPDIYPLKHQDHYSHHFDHVGHDDDVALSYQNQHFGHDNAAISYQNQYLYDNDISSYDDDDHSNGLHDHDSLLDNSHLDAPEYLHGYGDYKNYGGDLGQYSQHAGLLDISNDHNIDHLLDPYSPSHSSYDSY